MDYFYSLSARGFFLEGVHKSIPADAKKISKSKYQELLAGDSKGLAIGELASGELTCQPSRFHSLINGEWRLDQDKVAADLMATMDSRIIELVDDATRQIQVLQDAIDLDSHSDIEVLRLQEWRSYRVQLMRLRALPSYPDVRVPTPPQKVIP